MRQLICLDTTDGARLGLRPQRRTRASSSSRAASNRLRSPPRCATQRGRMVAEPQGSDFELFDDGQKRALSNVWSEPSPASVAILMDVSGSMSTKTGPRARNGDLARRGAEAGCRRGRAVLVRHGAEGSAAVLDGILGVGHGYGTPRRRTARHRSGMPSRKPHRKSRTGSAAGRLSSSPTASIRRAR